MPGASSESRGGSAPLEVAPGFWEDDVIRKSSAARHMGHLIRAYRLHPSRGRRPLSQEVVAGWAGITQAQLSRIETGPPIVHLDRLIHWARLLQVPEELLWFRLPASAESPLSTADAASAADDPLALLQEQWHLLVRTDNLIGPRFALAGVRGGFAAAEHLTKTRRAAERAQAVALAARFAESAAWLHEEVEQQLNAAAWTGRALELAYEAGDDVMVAWCLHRRSQQATGSGDPGQVIGLAEAARRDETALPTTARAALRVQQARGHAEDHDHRAALSLLDRAHDWAGTNDDGDAREGLGAYCTDAYIEVKRAECLMMLGRPRDAAQVYESAVPALPAVYRRDQAAGLVGLAAACLADHRHDQAADALRTALPLAATVGSARLVRQAVRLAGHLDAAHGLQDLVHAVLEMPR